MRFLVAFKKEGKILVKIDFGGEIGEKWASTSEAVYDYAKSNIKGNDKNSKFPGEEVNVEYTEKDGKYTVSRITKLGQDSGQPSETKTESTSGICADCGATGIDKKYTKCYTCNKKNPVKPKSTKDGYNQDAVNRQNANNATSRALIALTGQVDPNNILELIDSIHAKFLKKITG